MLRSKLHRTEVLGVEEPQEPAEAVEPPSPSFSDLKKVVRKETVKHPIDHKDVLESLNYFSQSSSLKQVKEDLIIKKKIEKFEGKFDKVLSSVNTELMDKNDLFLVVAQCAEDYFFVNNEEKCKKIKETVCIKLLKGYVKGDEAICKQILSAVQGRVKKSTFLRRNKKAIIKTFFLLVKLLLKTK